MSETDALLRRIAALEDRLAVQEAEADIRRIQARYMWLCDTPCPEHGVDDDEERIDRILSLYTEDAVWEGVGAAYTNQFGRAVGHDAIRAHFQRFWNESRTPRMLLNVHYLTSEQITVQGDEAEGQWVHCQPWVFDDGSALLRSSRLNNAFRRTGNGWRISRTRTENLFTAPLADGALGTPPLRSVLMQPDPAQRTTP